MTSSKPPVLTEEIIKNSKQLSSIIVSSKETLVEAYDDCENILWEVKEHKNGFIIVNPQGEETLTLKRKYFLLPFYDIFTTGKQIGNLKRVGFFNKAYKLSFENGDIWDVYLPLGSMVFIATSNKGKNIWFRYPSVKHWQYLVDSIEDNLYVLYCLSIVHLKWWRL